MVYSKGEFVMIIWGTLIMIRPNRIKKDGTISRLKLPSFCVQLPYNAIVIGLVPKNKGAVLG